MSSNKPRDIREHQRFTAAKMQLHDDPRIVDDLLFGVTTIISRAPELGELTHDLPGWRIWAMQTTRWMGAPPLTVYYEFDDEVVTLLDIKPTAGY